MDPKKKRLALAAAALVVIALFCAFVIPKIVSNGQKNSIAMAAGYIITETEGAVTAPAKEPWIAYRRDMKAQEWRFLGSSEEGELTEETLAGMKTIILCDGAVGSWSSYSGIGVNGNKQSEEVKMTYIDAETRRRVGAVNLLSAQKLPDVTTNLSALTYSDDEILKRIRSQIASGIVPGYPALGMQDSSRDRVAAMPADGGSLSADDLNSVRILILPEGVSSLPAEIAQNLWFVIVNPGSEAAAWAEETGIPYLPCGSETLIMPASGDPQRLDCPDDHFLYRETYLRLFDELGLTAIRLPDGMSPDETVLTESWLPFVVNPDTNAERALRRANATQKSAGFFLSAVFEGEGALRVRERGRVFFGSYDQDGIPENGNEPISWDVVTVRGDQALLAASRVLDLQSCGEGFRQWEDSPLRLWLNSDFLNAAFTEEEQRALLPSGPDDKGTKQIPYGRGEDLVFVPSSQDVDPFHPLYAMTEEVPATPRVLSAGIPDGYRMASSFSSSNRDVNIYAWTTRGGGHSDGVYIKESSDRGVRPMIWVSLSDPALIAENTPVQPESPGPGQDERLAAAAGSLKAGDAVFLGAIDQDGYPATAEEIEWIVLEVKNGKALLLARDVLAVRQQRESGYYHSWDGSDLRLWLNADFYNGCFTAKQRAAIVRSDISNSNSEGKEEWYSSETNGTKDRVFLLSYKDVKERYAGVLGDRLRALPSARAVLDGVLVKDGRAAWWLRSVGSGSYSFAAISGTGSEITVFEADLLIGVRPALWLDLSAFTAKTGQ